MSRGCRYRVQLDPGDICFAHQRAVDASNDIDRAENAGIERAREYRYESL